jgi:hypothetical protein
VTDPLAATLAAALNDAQRRYRAGNRLGSLCTPTIPTHVIDRFAEALVPVMRELVREAVTQLVAAVAQDDAIAPEPLPLVGADTKTGCIATARTGSSCLLCRAPGAA